jgi:hypothetical protein
MHRSGHRRSGDGCSPEPGLRGGTSPALTKPVLRGHILAGTEPKRTRGTRRAFLGTQRGWPETVRDLCRRGAALVAGEQRGRGSGSGLSRAWHGAAPARPQEPTEGLSTGIRHRRGAVDGKGLTRGGEGRSVLVEGGLGAALQSSWHLGQRRTQTGKIVPGLMSHPIYKNINRAIIYAPGSSHAYIQQIIKISQHMSRITLI